MDEINLTQWWTAIDESWKKLFKHKLCITSEPTFQQLRQLISSDELYCVLETDINDLKPIEVFTRLKKVDLMGTKNIQSITPLINNVNLIHLNIADTKVNNIEALSLFPKLEDLFLSDYVVNLDSISNLANLRRLFFRTSKAIESLDPLSKLTELEELAISDSITNLQPIDKLMKLKRLVGYGISKAEENRFQSLHPNTELNCGSTAKKEMERITSKIDKIDFSKFYKDY